jgi:hypothetical protein
MQVLCGSKGDCAFKSRAASPFKWRESCLLQEIYCLSLCFFAEDDVGEQPYCQTARNPKEIHSP